MNCFIGLVVRNNVKDDCINGNFFIDNWGNNPDHPQNYGGIEIGDYGFLYHNATNADVLYGVFRAISRAERLTNRMYPQFQSDLRIRVERLSEPIQTINNAYEYLRNLGIEFNFRVFRNGDRIAIPINREFGDDICQRIMNEFDR